MFPQETKMVERAFVRLQPKLIEPLTMTIRKFRESQVQCDKLDSN